jgi:hypothetical protein
MTSRFLSAFAALMMMLGTPMSAVAATAADDASHFRLTEALLQKMAAADAEAKAQASGDDADEADDDEDADDGDADEDTATLIRRIEGDSRQRVLLAKHGLTARELVLAGQAMFAAGFYLGFEPSMEKAAAAKLYNGYTAEQKANIELLRKRQKASGGQ